MSNGKIYRSAHYIIKYEGIYLEIQARTLFEESWGEIDHAIVYPYHMDEPTLKEYTGLLNRLTGLADEMASFFVHIEELESKSTTTPNPSVPAAAEDKKSGMSASPVFKEEGFSANVSTSDDAEASPSGMVRSIVRSE